jgi:hypothetical protein
MELKINNLFNRGPLRIVYCNQDTQGMIDVLECLKTVAKNPFRYFLDRNLKPLLWKRCCPNCTFNNVIKFLFYDEADNEIKNGQSITT